MRNIFIISMLFLSFFQLIHSEESTGEVVLYVFSLGKPAKDMRVIFNDKTVEFTDESGAARATLNAGRHKVKVTASKKVVAVAEFLVAAGESTRIIISAKDDGTNSEVEIEHPEGGVEKVAENINKNLAPGVFSGVVTSLVDKNAVPQASIFIKGIRTRVSTDDKGAFKIELPPGSYAVSFIHAQFSTQTVEGIEIKEGAETVRNVELTPASIELDEYVVLVPHIQGGIASLMEERRESSAVSDVIGAEQMSKSGDSNAASALKRVTGLTVVGGKYVYVRGMGERYSSTLLNGSTLPSPEPEKRVVPLDIFPTGMLQSVEVQKTFTPDMPGEFGGGVIKIKTKGIPEKFTASLSLSAGFADDSFSTGMSYKGGKYDWLGIDDGSRDIPKDVLDATKGGVALKEKDKYSKEGFTKEEMETLGESFPNRWNTHETMILPDLGFSITLGDRWKLSDVSFGLLGSFSYSNGMETKETTTNSYGFTGDDLASKSRYVYDVTTNDIKMGSILESGLDIGKHTKIGNTLLVLRTTEDAVSVAEGYNFEIGDNTKTTKLRWTEQMLISEQIRGNHKIAAAGDLGFDWRYTFSRAEMKMPDSRHYRYDFYPDEDRYLITKTTKSNERAYTYLVDNNHDFGFDMNKPFKIYKDLDLKLKTGFNLVAKDRVVDTRRFGYKIKNRDPEYTSLDMESILSPENIGPSGAVIGEITRNTDNYLADQMLLAGFFMFDWEIWKGLVLTAGMRYENSKYAVKTYELYASNPEIIESPLKSDDFLPAASLVYKLPHDMQIRAGYSLTVNRPSLKELSPAMMDDVEGGGETLGNPELKQADIHSVDFRYEWYFSTMESLSAAFFFKHFEKPIEQVYTDASGESKTFKNGKSARNLGVELEARKNFGFIHDSLEDLFLAGNFSYIYSVVDVENEDERPLQGQSPWIINLQLGYDNSDIGTSVSILYNMFGKRLDTLAVTGPHAYEQPWHQLDLVASQTFKHGFKLSFKATNLIDLPVEVYYEGDGIKKIRSTYKKGREFSVGLGWSY